MSLWILLLLQAAAPSPDQQLFNRLLDENRIPARLELVVEFEKRFPKSKLAGEVYGIAMDCHQLQNNAAKMIEYGEKAIAADSDNIHALVVVSRRYVMEGRNFTRAQTYAEQVVRIAPKLLDRAPAGYNKREWSAFVRQNVTAAEGIIRYIRELPSYFIRRGRRSKPPGA